MSKIIRGVAVFGETSELLTDAGTTLDSAGLADLPVVASPNIAVITLDPDREHGAPETVIVTAHTADASSATVTRGADGTMAREHPSGTHWENAGRLEFDRGGGVLDGDSNNNVNSLAIGPGAEAATQDAVAVGPDAYAQGHDTINLRGSVAVGVRASALGQQSVAVGFEAEALGRHSVVLGFQAEARDANGWHVVIGSEAFAAGQGNHVVIGRTASATGIQPCVSVGNGAVADSHAVAIGASAEGSGREGVAIGYQSKATVRPSSALGFGAEAVHVNAVALGNGAVSSVADQVTIGPRHLEVGDVSTPGTPAAGFGRLAFRDNDGTQELVAVFDTGEVKVLADGTA